MSADNATSSLSKEDMRKIEGYVDTKIDQLKMDIIKYVDEKFRQDESKGKELVLSNQTKMELQATVHDIIKRDVAPVISRAVNYVKLSCEDGNELVTAHRREQFALMKKEEMDTRRFEPASQGKPTTADTSHQPTNGGRGASGRGRGTSSRGRGSGHPSRVASSSTGGRKVNHPDDDDELDNELTRSLYAF